MTDVSAMELNIENLRANFPILAQTNREKPLIYLDNAATSQKPSAVIKAISDYYTYTNANVHRGVYQLCEKATGAYEATRQSLRHFINARRNHEIIFTRGTTEAINL